MRLPDGTILMHAGKPYDPAKAHEYYLRTRELKGRKHASVQATAGRARAAHPSSGKLVQQRAKAAARVASLQTKLSQLQDALREAMAREDKAKREADKPLTAAEKSKKAREAKQYRKTHKQELKTKSKRRAAASGGGSNGDGASTGNKVSSVSDIKAAIEGVQRALAAAKARQRALG